MGVSTDFIRKNKHVPNYWQPTRTSDIKNFMTKYVDHEGIMGLRTYQDMVEFNKI